MQSIDDYNDLRVKKQEQRDVRLIAIHSDNDKRLREATNLWCKLKVEFEKNVLKKQVHRPSSRSAQPRADAASR